MTGELPSLDFSQSINAANVEKNRYDDKIPCEFTCTKYIFFKTVVQSVILESHCFTYRSSNSSTLVNL